MRKSWNIYLYIYIYIFRIMHIYLIDRKFMCKSLKFNGTSWKPIIYFFQSCLKYLRYSFHMNNSCFSGLVMRFYVSLRPTRTMEKQQPSPVRKACALGRVISGFLQVEFFVGTSIFRERFFCLQQQLHTAVTIFWSFPFKRLPFFGFYTVDFLRRNNIWMHFT